MRAVVYEKYGPPDVLHLKELSKPIAGDDEVLIQIRATTATTGDARVRALNVPEGFGLMSRLIFGVFAPRKKILGVELAGVVAAIGKDVTRFKVGDEVFAAAGMSMGCYAEFRVIKESGAIVKKPASLSFEEAAALSFGGNTALDFFRRGELKSGERVLINGASGAVGSAAVQLAKHLGAHVTGVCSTANLELVRSLGADVVVDYTNEDFTARGESYDLIMDTAGTSPYARCKHVLAPKGRLLLVLASLPAVLGAIVSNLFSDKKIIAGPAPDRAEDLRVLAELAERGKYRPVIDRAFPLEQTSAAHAYVDSGRKRGNVVLTIDHAV